VRNGRLWAGRHAAEQRNRLESMAASPDICAYCGKRCYPTYKAARRAMRRNHRGVRTMEAYECHSRPLTVDTVYHYGTPTDRLTAARPDRVDRRRM